MVARRFPNSEHQSDRLGPQATGDEGQRLEGGVVEPLRVVGDADQRLRLGGVGQQRRERRARRGTDPGTPRPETERRPKCVALRSGEAVEMGEKRRAQLVQAGERELISDSTPTARAMRHPPRCP